MSKFMHFRYEIDSENAVRIWDENNPDELGRPFFYQPTYPDNTPWEDAAAAEAWTIKFLTDLTTPAPVEEVAQSPAE